MAALDGWLGLMTANSEASGPAYYRAHFNSGASALGPITATSPEGAEIIGLGIFDAAVGGRMIATFTEPHLAATLPHAWPNAAHVINLGGALQLALNSSAQGYVSYVTIRRGEIMGTIDAAEIRAATALIIRDGRVVVSEVAED